MLLLLSGRRPEQMHGGLLFGQMLEPVWTVHGGGVAVGILENTPLAPDLLRSFIFLWSRRSAVPSASRVCLPQLQLIGAPALT